MQWFLPWSESIKKRACRYLLQRYLGQFFEEKLTLDQLSVDLYNGTGTVADVSLDVQALNELGEQQNWPMEFVDGYIEQMSISIPWSSLLKDSSNIEVRGLNITVQPKQRPESATSMFESMWSSMTSSMQLAQECLKQDMPNVDEGAQPMEGIERFAQTIDSILSRVKVQFVNTIIRLEHVPKDSTNGVALQINIKNVEYLDEAGDDPSANETPELASHGDAKAYVISTFTLKKLILEGVTLHSEEFPSRARTFSRSMMSQSNIAMGQSSTTVNDNDEKEEFLSTIIDGATSRKQSETNIEEAEPNKSPLDVIVHDPILFGKLSGRQEIRIKLKQSETIAGPKVSMDMTFGSLMLFLSPRQLHVLLELAEGVASPHLEDNSNVPNKTRCTEKPMGGLDYQRVEEILQHSHLNSGPALRGGLQNQKGWSTPPFYDDNDDDSEFLPMKNPNTMSDSIMSSTNSMDSSITSSISSVSTRNAQQKQHRRNSDKLASADSDPTAEITHFQVRLASLAIVLLHEDLLQLSSGIEPILVPSSISHMKHVAQTFFDSLGPFGIMGYGNKDFENAKNTFEKACQLNHIRLLCAPLHLEGDQKSTATIHALSMKLTSAKLEVLECLWNGDKQPVEYVKLISEIENSGKTIGTTPFLRLTYKSAEKISKHKLSSPNRTEINLQLNDCLTEFDISIIDRISAVLNPQPVCNKVQSTSENIGAAFVQPVQSDVSNVAENRYDLKLNCPLFIIKLRFPIPDFRQPHDMQRLPWWKRNVRPDFVTLNIYEASVTSCMFSSQVSQKYQILCKTADLFYTDESGGDPLHIDSDESESSENDNDGIFYSVCESRFKKPIELTSNPLGQSYLSFNIHIIQGILTMNPPFRDTSLKVIPEQQGELVLMVEDAKIFTVSQYMGDSDLSYVCVQCGSASLHHGGMASSLNRRSATLRQPGKIAIDDKCSLVGFNWPRMNIEIFPISNLENENLTLENESMGEPHTMKQSMDGFNDLKGESGSKHPSPFSSKRIVHESDTPHSRQQTNTDGATEELIIPGDRVEMNNFIEHSIRSSRIRLDLFVPSLSVQLVSKHIYELIYNRINSDILMWEPSAPKPQVQGLNLPSLGCDLQESMYPMFSMCKSGIQYNSDSDESESSENDNDGIFYSVCESRFKKPIELTSNPLGQSYLSFNIHIIQGILTMNPPFRDTSLKVIPEQQGELVLMVEDAKIFTVSQYMGDSDLSYVCVQCGSASLHHGDMASSLNRRSAPLRQPGFALPRNVHPTIVPSEIGVSSAQVSGKNASLSQRDMLSVAVRVQSSHETHHVKTVRVAVGLKMGTLKHRSCAEPNSWFTQMIDFFDVLDYPIAGYTPMSVLTEFHLHLWDCAIDYRPLRLPLRSMLTIGSFSMSSHLAAQVNTSTLRFIAEECNMFLSDRISGGATAPVDLKRDYVCVLELSLFELSLRLSEKTRGLAPHIDLRASNNVVHVRTCSDTARALMQLITYFATDGDLAPTQPEQDDIKGMEESGGSSKSGTPRKGSSVSVNQQPQLLNVEPQEISSLSTSQHEQVNELLGEAMKESLVVAQQNIGNEDDIGTGTDVFFFPDESRPLPPPKTSPSPIHRPPSVESFRTTRKNSDTDDEFCIIGDEAGLGIFPRSGLPEIRWLTEDPVRIVDNHFTVPVGKTDLLKAPKHFPMAVLRYTLCEMTLVWHIYGGYDFQSSVKNEKENIPKKTVNFYEDRNRDRSRIEESGVSFSRMDGNSVTFTSSVNKKKKDEELNKNWRVKGGIGRDHDVLMELHLNKVRFQHEVYPEDTVQASRQVLLISDVKIRDRLASSSFNMFLYQHTSQARPKQSHANMVVIKATHIRPDTKLPAQECILRISIMPLRLNVDQDSLLFLVKFFRELGGQTEEITDTLENNSRHTTPTHQPPVMSVSLNEDDEETLKKRKAQKMVSDNLLILLDGDETEIGEELVEKQDTTESIPQTCSSSTEDSPPPIYFRNVLFSPDVPIRLDYQGKHVDMTHGPLAGLLMGLGELNCSELRLKRLSHRHGLLGVDRLISYAVHEWLQDIKRHQLQSILGGFGPMHSFVQLFQGIRDLFWLPIEQYQKDGRVVRGLQRGANSFTTSTAMAALELTSRIIHLIQATAETAYDMVSPGPSVRRRHPGKSKKGSRRRRRYAQPQDIREGVANAYAVVKEGVSETAGTIVRVASQEHEQKGYSGAVGGVLRQIPPTFVKPIIIASEATKNVLGGMQSQLLPDARREASQKWRSDDG